MYHILGLWLIFCFYFFIFILAFLHSTEISSIKGLIMSAKKVCTYVKITLYNNLFSFLFTAIVSVTVILLTKLQPYFSRTDLEVNFTFRDDRLFQFS